ncbi:alpha/beta fold hydrolase [Nocardioides sp. CPCC 205120]|uniref:alpha/beta fold hydrolase n=1 Tax=Nocardioides sp. CPCC 205120 TaxID=3406462 RepID=UPI003B5006FD
MSLSLRLNVSVTGPLDAPPVVFVHGFGCGQQMWRRVAPAVAADHRVVLLDLVGSGASDMSAYDSERYASLDGYVDDILGLLREMDLSDVAFVGHSVSAMIGVLAQLRAPELVSRLVLVAPSARYVDDDGYVGGFSESDIDDLLRMMDHNHLGWQNPLAGIVAGSGQGGDPAAAAELESSFCRTRPDIAHQFATVTFRGDNRADLAGVDAPTLVLQSAIDAVAPPSAGRFVHEQIAGSVYEVIETVGHCPHLTAPAATTDAIRAFLTGTPA